MKEILKISALNLRRAKEIIQELDIVNIWKSIGAEAHLVGSVRTGLLLKNLDIDFHIYSSSVSITDSYAAMGKLSKHPGIKRVEYRNMMVSNEECVEWHAWYQDKDYRFWQLDMIHIKQGSYYDGHFEEVADRIIDSLTPSVRKAILKLKYETPDREKIMGIEYCKAVISEGITDYEEFMEWRKRQPSDSFMEWMP